MNNWTEKEVQSTIEQVRKKASTDSEFRKLCLENPAGAVKEVSGKELPEGLIIKFVENAGAHMTFVLPDMISTGELVEEDLEQVAGGAQGKPPYQV